MAGVTKSLTQARISKFVMQASETSGMALDEDDLREVDRFILDYLQEGRVTPAYCRDRIIQEGHREDLTSTYCGQRLQRLEEHAHVENLLGAGLYQLVTDPREGEDV